MFGSWGGVPQWRCRRTCVGRSFVSLTYRPFRLACLCARGEATSFQRSPLEFSYVGALSQWGFRGVTYPGPPTPGTSRRACRAPRAPRPPHTIVVLAAVCKTVIGPSVRASAWLYRQASAQAHHPRMTYGTELQSYPGQRGDCWIASRLEIHKKAGTRRLSVPHHHHLTSPLILATLPTCTPSRSGSKTHIKQPLPVINPTFITLPA